MRTKPRGFSLGLFSTYRNELYGLSILSIFLYHFCLNRTEHFGAAAGAARFVNLLFGAVGVEVFVFLSGMGLWYSYSRQLDGAAASRSDRLAFYRRRLSRILPVYLPAGILFWAVRGALEGSGFLRFLGNLTFVTFFTRGTHTIWYVGFILLMYLAYPLIHRILNGAASDGRISASSRAIRLLCLYAVFAALMLLYRHFVPVHYDRELMAWIRIPIFLLGCYLAPYIKAGKVLPAGAAYGGTAALLAIKTVTMALPRAETVQVFYNSLYALALMVLLCRLLDALPSADASGAARAATAMCRTLQFFGRYSLELYVIHVCLRNLVKYKGWPIWDPGVFAAVILVSLILSLALHKLTERLSTITASK